MYRRGFFLITLLFLFTQNGLSAELDFELTGSVGTEEASHNLNIGLEKKLANLELSWGIDLAWRTNSDFTTPTRWQIKTLFSGPIQLVATHNQDHYTSPDLFRLINKNNYYETSYFLALYTEQLQMGFLRSVPLKNIDIVDAIFLASELQLGSALLETMQLKYAGLKESGTACVLGAKFEVGNWHSEAALGLQTDSAGTESAGYVFELTRNSPCIQTEFSWQKTDPSFLSPLAKSNKYTPNRLGWQLKASSSVQELDFEFNLRRHTNLEKTRTYPQLALKIKSKLKNTSLEWRLEPTQAFILRYAEGDHLFQLDALNSILRYDTKFADVIWGFRFDATRIIARLEAKLENTLEWRLIGKYDFLGSRSHYSILACFRHENKHLQLEIGQYDRGNMAAGFNNAFSFRISWGWKF